MKLQRGALYRIRHKNGLTLNLYYEGEGPTGHAFGDKISENGDVYGPQFMILSDAAMARLFRVIKMIQPSQKRV